MSGRHNVLSVWPKRRDPTATDDEGSNVTPISSVRPKRRSSKRDQRSAAQGASEVVGQGASSSEVRELTTAIKGLTKAITQAVNATTQHKTSS